MIYVKEHTDDVPDVINAHACSIMKIPSDFIHCFITNVVYVTVRTRFSLATNNENVLCEQSY